LDDFPGLKTADPDDIVALAAKETNNVGVAYTYNEPLVWIEFMLETAIKIKEKNLKNVMVTNGFINPEPLEDLIRHMDAFSVDLKSFTEAFYKKLTASRLAPVLDALRTIKRSGKHLEITNLVIPNQNDDPDDFNRMVGWIAEELGAETVLHISRYFPTYKMNEPPTPEKKLLDLFEMARKKLHHVYVGNLRTGEGQNTYCPNCSTLVISRIGYTTEISGLDREGCCLNCRTDVVAGPQMHLF
jgi:pyruvate formate lyase activating enzyme